METIPFLDIDVWHAFFYFLGQPTGEFTKKTFELLIFGLLTYMIWIEYIKSKREDLKVLGIGFAALALEKFFSISLYAPIVFGTGYSFVSLPFIPLIDNTLEIFALILVTNALIYPLFRKRVKKFKDAVKKEVLILAAATIFFEAVWLFYFHGYVSDFRQFGAILFFDLFKMGILGIAALQIVLRMNVKFRYREWILLALLVYMVSPIIHIINFIAYDNTNVRLAVMASPFPFIAALIIFHLIYLKLVDKATLRKQVRISEKKYQQEKEVSMLKDKFLSVVSHELRTPLTSIKLYLGLLLKGTFGKVSKKQKNAVTVVKRESDRLTELINDVLDLSKLESGDILKKETFKLRSLVDTIRVNQAKEKNIIVLNAIPDTLEVYADKRKMQQLMINLLSNAIKFTNPGGKITATGKEESKSWLLRITDTGVGIPEEELPHIFDKFYQVENHMIRTKGGTGLGLAIVQEIVQLHKGDIHVSSEIGRGTTFLVRIPKEETV